MFSVTLDPKAFLEGMSDLEKRQLPFALVGAVNDSLFAVRTGWQQEIRNVFDQPTPLTINAVLYHKATKSDFTAELYLRNEAANGTPPSRYLLAEVQGGARREKPFEHLLREAGVLGGNEFAIPARGFPLDSFGNIPGQVAQTILSDLQASRDVNRRSTAESRGKRERRKKISSRATYFEAAPQLAASQGRRQHLPRGIYQRTRFSSGSAIRMVMVIVSGAPHYAKRFDAYELAHKLWNESFPGNFKKRLAMAVATAKLK